MVGIYNVGNNWSDITSDDPLWYLSLSLIYVWACVLSLGLVQLVGVVGLKENKEYKLHFQNKNIYIRESRIIELFFHGHPIFDFKNLNEPVHCLPFRPQFFYYYYYLIGKEIASS
jgi:hypothetical protein